ncbi:MAG: hypothetical protein PHF00_10105, partial [Elusimicrobia bacterium]|nr:hypothetical protein [Elusimicrobiota bacterium]
MRKSLVAPSRALELRLQAYGPQGWWPVTPPRGLEPRYRPRARLSERQRFEVCLGAILTQNTNWSNVVKALRELAAAGVRDLPALEKTPLRRLRRL